MNYLSWNTIKDMLPYFVLVILIIVTYGVLILLKRKAKNKIDKKIASIKTKRRT